MSKDPFIDASLDRWFFRSLLAGGFLELVLLRVLSRLSMHIPKEACSGFLLESLFKLLFSFGTATYFVTYGLAFIALLLVVYHQLQPPCTPALLTTFCLLFLLTANIYFLFLPFDPTLSLLYDLAASGVILGTAFASIKQERSGPQKVLVLLLTLTYLCSLYFKSSYALARLLEVSTAPILVTQIFSLGELLVVTSSVMIFMVHSRRISGSAKREIFLASSVTLLYLAAHLASPYTVAILATWSLGLSLYLPFPLYATALWLFSFTVIRCLRAGEKAGYGLAFIFIAGYSLTSPHLLLLAILGFSLLAEPSAAGKRGQEEPLARL